MIKKLFGESEEEQYNFLKKRIILVIIGLIPLVIGGILSLLDVSIGETFLKIGEMILCIAALLFGWPIIRALFGYSTIASLFSKNVVIGVVLFVLTITLGYFAGIFISIIGIIRFLIILKNRKQG